MNLDAHGAACRCLLRLRENQGEPGISDAAFIARFLPRYPEWKERPGATDTLLIIEIARELGVASHADTFVEYDRVLAEHRAGRGVLLATARAPQEVEIASTAQRHIMLLVEMSDDHFTAWCPYASGHSDMLPLASRIWWERWQTSGLVLYPAPAAVISDAPLLRDRKSPLPETSPARVLTSFRPTICARTGWWRHHLHVSLHSKAYSVVFREKGS